MSIFPQQLTITIVAGKGATRINFFLDPSLYVSKQVTNKPATFYLRGGKNYQDYHGLEPSPLG